MVAEGLVVLEGSTASAGEPVLSASLYEKSTFPAGFVLPRRTVTSTPSPVTAVDALDGALPCSWSSTRVAGEGRVIETPTGEPGVEAP